MRFVDAAEIDAVLDCPAPIDALAGAFRAGIVVPVRHPRAIERDGETATLTSAGAPATEITRFKSAGSAIEDIAAAVPVWQRMHG